MLGVGSDRPLAMLHPCLAPLAWHPSAEESTCPWFCAGCRYTGICEMLLAADASCINAVDAEGDTPLVRCSDSNFGGVAFGHCFMACFEQWQSSQH